MNTPASPLRHLDFQGQPIYYLALPEGNMVLIRPLCEALGIDADWQIRELKTDEMVSGEVCEHTTRLPSEDRSRPYTCLPEEFIYGWIFGIKFSNTMKPETKSMLIEYKRGCYHALYNHFHGALKEALHLQTEQVKVNLELKAVNQRIDQKMQGDADYERKAELEAKQKQLKRAQDHNQKQSRQTAFAFVIAELEAETR